MNRIVPSLFSDITIADDAQDIRASYINLVQHNTRIIDGHSNSNILLFKEAIKIKELKPVLKHGLKASKKLKLF